MFNCLQVFPIPGPFAVPRPALEIYIYSESSYADLSFSIPYLDSIYKRIAFPVVQM